MNGTELQTLNIAPNITGWRFFVKENASVQLAGNDMKLNGNSTITVETEQHLILDLMAQLH